MRFCFFKDKDEIIKNGRKLRNCNVGVSEDYSKATLAVHKELRKQASEAKDTLYSDPVKAIIGFRIIYRRVVLTYTTDKNNRSATTFTRSFSPEYMSRNPEWYVPQERRV